MANDLWETPQYIFDWLDDEFKFNIDAACISNNCKCEYGYFNDKGVDGLNEIWSIWNTTWLNPPYSNPYPWVKKSYKESLRGSNIVCLLPADTSTKWFHEWVIGKAEVRFVQGRIKFINPETGRECKDSPKFGSMIAVYGPEVIPKVLRVKRPDKPKE